VTTPVATSKSVLKVATRTANSRSGPPKVRPALTTIDDAVATLEEAGSIDFARETAEGLIQDGKDNLAVLPDNGARDLLEGIADFLIEREY